MDEQLAASGYGAYLTEREAVGATIRGRVALVAVPLLARDPRFASGKLSLLHRDIGGQLADFRSYNGTFGPGSLQIVIDTQTGAFYADVDRFNPYQDVVNVMGHLFGEVVPHALLGWVRRRKRA